MLTPPKPKDDHEATKRSEAVFRAERMEKEPTGEWAREVVYFFEGDEYPYTIVAFKATTEAEARRILYDDKPTKELQSAFLRDVRLDMTRPH